VSPLGATASGRARNALLAATVGSLLASAPAPGYLRDFTVAPATSSAASSSLHKTLPLQCLGHELGSSAAVRPTLSDLGLTDFGGYLRAERDVFPGAGAAETDETTASWSLTGEVFCATGTSAPPPFEAAGRYLKAVEIARARSPSSSAGAKSATTSCPAGKTAISGGAQIVAGSPDVALDAVQRTGGGSGWRASAHEVDPTDAGWQIVASAVCANVTTETDTTDYVSGVSRTGTYGQPGSGRPQTINLSCPPGKSVLGGSAHIKAPSASGFGPPDVVLTSSYPFGDGPTATSWTATARETDPTVGAWRLGGVVLCAELDRGPPE
jgi:hypothetical protein